LAATVGLSEKKREFPSFRNRGTLIRSDTCFLVSSSRFFFFSRNTNNSTVKAAAHAGAHAYALFSNVTGSPYLIAIYQGECLATKAKDS